MAEYLTPGVYVEEFDSGEPPMASVSTSTAGFIGLTEKGPQFGQPVLVTNFASFKRIFGGYLSEGEFGEYRYLAYSVSQFFINGGSRCYIKRVVPSNAAYAYNTEDTETAPIVIYARDPGAWGNKIVITAQPSSKTKTHALEKIDTAAVKYRLKNAQGFSAGDIVCVSDENNTEYNRVTDVDENTVTFENEFEFDIVDARIVPKIIVSKCAIDFEIKYESESEVYENCTLNPASSDNINDKMGKSELVVVEAKSLNEIISPFKLITGKDDGKFTISLFGGSNGTKDTLSAVDFMGEDGGPGNRTGIQAFIDNNEVSILAVPGIVDASVALSLVAHCENMSNRFAILDVPRDKKTVNDVLEYRNLFDSEFAAMYHPWIKMLDPLTKRIFAIPPSGSIAGIYARTDSTRGVHKAPANETISNCSGLDCNYTTGEQDVLNPKGVNLIRSFPGQGIRVWGARTVSSNSLWRYVNVRRLFIFIEESIRASTNWVVFEPNEQLLWLRVRRTIEIFLGDVWRAGALAGATEDEAFFVDIGPNTMSQGDIDAGRLICVIGVAPVKPAEFVIFRITQKTSGAE